MIHTVQWQITSPLWSEALQDEDNKRFRQPAILCFASDAFMKELEDKLSTDPSSLQNLVAHHETWQSTPSEAVDPDQPLKLYQPVHQRFYLVTASLVCRLPGLPDRVVDAANEERVSFVLRRLVPRDKAKRVRPSDPTTYFEYSWVEGTAWQKLDSPYDRVADGEEHLPMFAMTFCENGRQRRLLAGLLPVAGRETYQAAPEISPPVVPAEDLTAEDSLADPRLAQFTGTVIAGLQGLLDAIEKQDMIGGKDWSPKEPPVSITDKQAREVLVFALLDLMTFLREHLQKVWRAVDEDSPAGLNTNERDLFDKLSTRLFPGGSFWDELLRDVWDKRENILLGGTEGLILLTDSLGLEKIETAINVLDIPGLTSLVKAALGTYTPPEEQPPETEDLEVSKIGPGADAVYVVRCVYERPRCKRVVTRVVSEPSQAFQLASFFDPDAPARPLRITMPVDTSIAGLRKFPKNVSFLISDQLRKQMARIHGVKLGDLDEGKLGAEPNIKLGMICSLSIPIITICALILLMIIVQLLNIVFWWLPFFKICFPLNLKAE